jgi:hypothetical protein
VEADIYYVAGNLARILPTSPVIGFSDGAHVSRAFITVKLDMDIMSRFSDDKSSSQQDLPTRLFRPVYSRQQQLRRRLPELVFGICDSSQSWANTPSDLNVIKTNNRHLIRNRDL